MSSFIPFNFNPDSTVQTTGSYEVPAGYYAIAHGEVERSGSNITVNGNTVLKAPENIEIKAQFIKTVSNSGPYTFTASKICEVQVYQTSSVGTLVRYSTSPNMSTTFIPQAEFVNLKLSSGDQIVWTGDSNGSGISIVGKYLDDETSKLTGYFWLKAGDIINGGYKHIAVYKIANTA